MRDADDGICGFSGALREENSAKDSGKLNADLPEVASSDRTCLGTMRTCFSLSLTVSSCCLLILGCTAGGDREAPSISGGAANAGSASTSPGIGGASTSPGIGGVSNALGGSSTTGNGSGGVDSTGIGGSYPGTGGNAGNPTGGATALTGGTVSIATGGTVSPPAGGATGNTGGTRGATGGTSGATGGSSSDMGGAGGENTGGEGGAGSGGENTGGVGPGSYALPPPDPCSNQFAVDECLQGDESSECGGVCPNDHGPTAKNACESGKEGVPVQFACPRFMLYASEMMQAAIDDGYGDAFNYAVVGHDPDTTNLDAGLENSCCQCYQLVFDVPTYLTASTLTPPKPLIVQSANTQASGPTGFDVFMGAGGFGVFNACDADIPMGSNFGYSQYATYPEVGQAFSGGVKPGPDSLDCADDQNNLSDALIADPSCQEKITAACNQITSDTATVQEETRRSCIQSNQAESYYHENWSIYVQRVVCPTHLMEVTGCKIPPGPGLPDPNPEVQTAAQAQAAGFSSEMSGQRYHTTTMQDCCMPTCAWSNNVRAETVDGYNSLYSCLQDGTPVTQ